MTDSRIQKLARILVDHSAAVQPGDRVAIETTTNAEPLVREVYELVLQRGGHPHLLLNLPDQEKLFFKHASDAQLDFTPTFQKLVTEQFEVYLRIRADVDTQALKNVPPERQSRRQKGTAPVRSTMLRRGGDEIPALGADPVPDRGICQRCRDGLRGIPEFPVQRLPRRRQYARPGGVLGGDPRAAEEVHRPHRRA